MPKQVKMPDGTTLVVIGDKDQESGQCELCGETAELRPYGPKGERICFDCGQKDLDAVERAMVRLFDGEPN